MVPAKAKYCWLCGRALEPGTPTRTQGVSGCLGAAATALGVVVVLVALFIIWIAAMVIAALSTCMQPCSH
jgi:hypothetical protein